MSCVNSTVPEETLPTGTVTIHRNKLGTAMLPTVCYFHINNINKHKRKLYEHFFVTFLLKDNVLRSFLSPLLLTEKIFPLYGTKPRTVNQFMEMCQYESQQKKEKLLSFTKFKALN
jgi:hypothetical protein